MENIGIVLLIAAGSAGVVGLAGAVLALWDAAQGSPLWRLCRETVQIWRAIL